MKLSKILDYILVLLCLIMGIAFFLGLGEANVLTAIGTIFILLAGILFDKGGNNE